MSLFLFTLICFLPISTVHAQNSDRSPHGLAQERPMPLSPAAIEFFHPHSSIPPSANAPCLERNCALVPLPSSSSGKRPLAAQLKERSESTARPDHVGIGAGGVIGIMLGCALLVVMPMGAYYVMVTRKNNMKKAISVQPSVWQIFSLLLFHECWSTKLSFAGWMIGCAIASINQILFSPCMHLDHAIKFIKYKSAVWQVVCSIHTSQNQSTFCSHDIGLKWHQHMGRGYIHFVLKNTWLSELHMYFFFPEGVLVYSWRCEVYPLTLINTVKTALFRMF